MLYNDPSDYYVGGYGGIFDKIKKAAGTLVIGPGGISYTKPPDAGTTAVSVSPGSGMTEFIKQNPLIVAGIAAGTLFLLSRIGKRR